jgi:predicted transcriptional regulator
MPAKVTSIRVDERKLKRLDRLARTMDRPRSWVLSQAIDRYIEHQDWFAREVERGVEQADRGELISHDEVMSEVREKLRKRRR